MRVLIVGCGYVGVSLGAELAGQGHEVFGLCRSGRVEAELKSSGARLLIGDITKPETLAQLRADYDWVVNCVSSSGGDEADYRAVYLQGTRHLIEWLSAAPPRKFVYTSSTSVYTQTDGSRVTEDSATEPASGTSKVLAETEKFLPAAAARTGFPAVILRVAGIYGPGRGHWLKQFLKNEAVVEGDGGRILNMIHRDDVAGAIVAALEGGRPGQIYNATDDEPVSQFEYFRWLAEKLRRPMPPSVPFDPQANRRRGVTSKKVSNRRLKTELGYQFKYPTFREGFAAAIKSLQS